MKAVMYGAGNIGRGFIGYLFGKSGYELTFIDVAEPVIHALNRDRAYPVRVVSSEGYEEELVSNVSAVDGRDEDAAAEAIAEADVMATAVGVNVMKFIAPVIAKGLKLRHARKSAPLNIIICENLIDANLVMAGLIKEHLDEAERVDEEADMTVEWVSLDDAVAMVLAGEIVNATSVAGILAASAADRTGIVLRDVDARWTDEPTALRDRRRS